MASNITEKTKPYIWNSANDNVIYEFDFIPYLVTDITDSSGNVMITLFGIFDVTPVIGEYIYINSNVYVGTYKILTVISNAIVILDLPYTSGITVDTYYCYHLRVPIFDFYKGFSGSSIFSDNNPLTKVISLKPSVLYDEDAGLPYLSINLRGAVKYIFNVIPNTVANSVDFSMFNAIKLVWDSVNSSSVLVLNSSITNEELVYNYISVLIVPPTNSDSTFLLPIDKPFIATQGITFCSEFQFYVVSVFEFYVVPMVIKYINGVRQ